MWDHVNTLRTTVGTLYKSMGKESF